MWQEFQFVESRGQGTLAETLERDAASERHCCSECLPTPPSNLSTGCRRASSRRRFASTVLSGLVCSRALISAACASSCHLQVCGSKRRSLFDSSTRTSRSTARIGPISSLMDLFHRRSEGPQRLFADSPATGADIPTHRQLPTWPVARFREGYDERRHRTGHQSPVSRAFDWGPAFGRPHGLSVAPIHKCLCLFR